MTKATGKPPVEPEWLSPKQVATKLSIGVNTVYEIIYRGELEAIRHGAPGSKKPALRVSVASLNAYVDRLRVSA